MGALSEDERRQFEELVGPLRAHLPAAIPSPNPQPTRRRRAALRQAVGRVSLPGVVALLAALLVLVIMNPIDLLPQIDRGPGSAADGRPLPAVPVTTSGEHAFLSDRTASSAPMTFDPCVPIEWELNPANMPIGTETLIHEAVADVSARTGLLFTYLGETERQIDLDRPSAIYQPALIAWSSADVMAELDGGVVGIGGPTTNGGRGGPGSEHYVSGTVALDAEELGELMRRSPHRVGLVIRHELGHLVGLDHVDNENELMHEKLLRQAQWGPGDLQGLALLGQGRCGG